MNSEAARIEGPAAGQVLGDQFLSFRCMGMSLALPISRIREIIEVGQLTVVPHMPEYVRGVINLRGNVVSVVDLSIRLSGRRGEGGRRACIVIIDLDVHGSLQRVGLLVDAVDAVLDIDPQSIEPPPRFGTGLSQDCIAGMARREQGFTVVLRADHIIGDDPMGLLGPGAAELEDGGYARLPAACG